MFDASRRFDVLVVGGGNAALCAAISAREAGASVILLESAPKAFRGGNSRHTRNLRTMHEAPTDILTGSYLEDEYWDDLLRVTGGRTDETLARMVIRETKRVVPWLAKQGVAFQPALTGTLSLSRTNAFFLGGGKALVNALYRTAERAGVEIHYHAEVHRIRIEDGMFTAAEATIGGFPEIVRARTLVAASGGFQANIGWLKEYWGEAAENFLIRGTPYAQGKVLRTLLDGGCAPVGDPTQCHAVAIDGRAPKFDGGLATRLDCIPFGIVVNREARRFYDEGEDVWPKRYAIWGRLVAQQPGQIAYAIVDRKAEELFLPSVYPPIRADSIGELAQKLELDAATLEATVRDFNAACRPGPFDPQALDGCRTEGLDPPKTHWARPLDTPRFTAFPLRPGITFTYLGVKVDETARIRMQDGKPAANLFAAGEIMSGSILGQGYLAGFGMAIGSVFGTIAGRSAARTARN
ncbi:MAG: FAD-dependent tricarballylate dehydrogenase TcuA [Acetobacteraceae bacterium]|nr:FAD-dependent tricarballylate dehydrogenase TcuA [Acetobacteraceae bacterium]